MQATTIDKRQWKIGEADYRLHYVGSLSEHGTRRAACGRTLRTLDVDPSEQPGVGFARCRECATAEAVETTHDLIVNL